MMVKSSGSVMAKARVQRCSPAAPSLPTYGANAGAAEVGAPSGPPPRSSTPTKPPATKTPPSGARAKPLPPMTSPESAPAWNRLLHTGAPLGEKRPTTRSVPWDPAFAGSGPAPRSMESLSVWMPSTTSPAADAANPVKTLL
ncbi:MAG: hypothetical protein QM820_22910 [Minicystis sp.]